MLTDFSKCSCHLLICHLSVILECPNYSKHCWSKEMSRACSCNAEYTCNVIVLQKCIEMSSLNYDAQLCLSTADTTINIQATMAVGW